MWCEIKLYTSHRNLFIYRANRICNKILDVTVTQEVELSYKCNNKWYFPSTSSASRRVNPGAIPKLSNTCPLWWYQHSVLHHHWHCQASNLWLIIMQRLAPQHSQLQELDKILVYSEPIQCPLCPCRVLTHYHNQQPVSPWLSSVSWIKWCNCDTGGGDLI